MSGELIFVVEDEADIREVIQYNLERDGFRVSVSDRGRAGLDAVRREHPDLVVLDLMLPEMDGIEICRRLKEENGTRSIPIIMVTAKGEESDVVLGLGVGADDYIVKPFSPKELVARVRAVLRRGVINEESNDQERVTLDGVVIDAGQHRVKVDAEDVNMTATELRLLHFLARHPGRVFARDHLLSRVMGEDAYVIDRNIDVHVRAIRKKLGHYRDLIETVRGVGYRFKDRDR